MPSLLSIQASLALIGLPVAATWPPAEGTILLVPITADARSRLATDAVNVGARLVDRGPLPGSLLVRGERARLRALPATLALSGKSLECGNAR